MGECLPGAGCGGGGVGRPCALAFPLPGPPHKGEGGVCCSISPRTPTLPLVGRAREGVSLSLGACGSPTLVLGGDDGARACALHFPGRRAGAYCTTPPGWRRPWAPGLRPGKCGGWGAADTSRASETSFPPPCGEGLRVGVVPASALVAPPPLFPPHKGEGDDGARTCHHSNSRPQSRGVGHGDVYSAACFAPAPNFFSI